VKGVKRGLFSLPKRFRGGKGGHPRQGAWAIKKKTGRDRSAGKVLDWRGPAKKSGYVLEGEREPGRNGPSRSKGDQEQSETGKVHWEGESRRGKWSNMKQQGCVFYCQANPGPHPENQYNRTKSRVRRKVAQRAYNLQTNRGGKPSGEE